MIKQALQKLRFDRSGLSAEGLASCLARLRQEDEEVYRLWRYVGAPLHVLLCVSEYLLAPAYNREVLFVGHAIFGVVFVLWYWLGARHPTARRTGVWCLYAATALPYSLAVHGTLVYGGDVSMQASISWMTFNLMMMLCIVYPPTVRSDWIMAAGQLPLLIWLHSSNTSREAILPVQLVSVGLTFCIRRYLTIIAWDNARQEVLARAAARRRAGERRDHEVQLARQILTSIGAPPRLVAAGYAIEVEPGAESDGWSEWQACRPMPDGRLVGLIADTMAGGPAAAIVLRVVQSMWVDATQRRGFAPEAWLTSLNRCLAIMSPATERLVGIRLVILDGDEIEAWSAGKGRLWFGDTDLGGGVPLSGAPLGRHLQLRVARHRLRLGEPFDAAVRVSAAGPGRTSLLIARADGSLRSGAA